MSYINIIVISNSLYLGKNKHFVHMHVTKYNHSLKTDSIFSEWLVIQIIVAVIISHCFTLFVFTTDV